jgi:hypothetical protein
MRRSQRGKRTIPRLHEASMTRTEPRTTTKLDATTTKGIQSTALRSRPKKTRTRVTTRPRLPTLRPRPRLLPPKKHRGAMRMRPRVARRRLTRKRRRQRWGPLPVIPGIQPLLALVRPSLVRGSGGFRGTEQVWIHRFCSRYKQDAVSRCHGPDRAPSRLFLRPDLFVTPSAGRSFAACAEWSDGSRWALLSGVIRRQLRRGAWATPQAPVLCPATGVLTPQKGQHSCLTWREEMMAG